MAYVVAAPLVLAKDQAGKVRYLYQNTQVPDDILDEDVLRLADAGLVEDAAKDEPAKAPARAKK